MLEEWKRHRQFRLRCNSAADELEQQSYTLLACNQISPEWFEVRLAVAAILRELPDMSTKERQRAQAMISEKVKKSKKK